MYFRHPFINTPGSITGQKETKRHLGLFHEPLQQPHIPIQRLKCYTEHNLQQNNQRANQTQTYGYKAETRAEAESTCASGTRRLSASR